MTTALELHVHRWEPATRPDARTILLLHGTGGDETDLLPLGRMLSPGSALLGVRGNVLENGAPRFFRRLAEGVFDIEDLHRRTSDLADFVAAASTAYGFDPTLLHALGYSNGANVAASLLLSRPGALAAAVLFRAMVPFEPAGPVDVSGKRVLISAGEFDAMIPRSGSERLATLLRAGGAEVTLAWQPASHGLTQADITAGQEFFRG
ncbi:MAG: alpha/beta hydrolase [Gemmatimonadota bacterium]|nr:alpha/beta hydrolase [Gemmatimonadota bacterium]